MPDKIEICDIRIPFHVGVTDEERALAQPVHLDLELYFPMSVAAQSDNVDDTVNYVEVCERLDELAAHRQFRLIEAMAGATIDALFERFPRIEAISIRIRKPLALGRRGISHTAVSMHRNRP